MNTILQHLHELSDTELRILLVLWNNHELLSVFDIQSMTSRGRQVYESLRSLVRRGILIQGDLVFVGTIRKWQWKCAWNTSVESSVTLPMVIQEVSETPKTKIASKKVVAKPKGNPNQFHPAVVAYVEATHRRPKGFVADTIAQQVAPEGVDFESWKTIVQQWVLTGWNPNNVDGMLEMYAKKHTPQTSKQRKRIVLNSVKTEKSAEVVSAEFEEYLRENGVHNEEN
jgi:hypothetical protein